MGTVMAKAASADCRYTAEEYFDLVAAGVLHPDDRVELLEGVIVAMAPQNPPHAGMVTIVAEALRQAVGERGVIRTQLPLVLGTHSVPEPDIALVPGPATIYLERHPTTAWLLIEIADTSLPQDRLTKARMYAAAGIVEYWIVNVPDRCLEVFRQPDSSAHVYRETVTALRGDRLELLALPGAVVALDDIIPEVGEAH